MSLDGVCPALACVHKGTYWITAICGNCGREFDVELTHGHAAHAAHPECTFCGVNNAWTWKPMDHTWIRFPPIPTEASS